MPIQDVAVKNLLKALGPFISEDQEWNEIKLTAYVKRDGNDIMFDSLLIKEYKANIKERLNQSKYRGRGCFFRKAEIVR